MSRRIDIELTSVLGDGTWTWRAAGARQPRGTLDGAILPNGAKVGDELKVEVEQELDGISVQSVVTGREKHDPDLLVLLPSEREFQPVIETRAGRERGERPRRSDGDRKPRRDDAGGAKRGDKPDRPPRDRAKTRPPTPRTHGVRVAARPAARVVAARVAARHASDAVRRSRRRPRCHNVPSRSACGRGRHTAPQCSPNCRPNNGQSPNWRSKAWEPSEPGCTKRTSAPSPRVGR